MDHFFMDDEHPWQELGGGLRRKIMPWTDDLMAVCMRFDKGAAAALHSHDVHTQITYIVEGRFEVEADGEKKILKAGDAFLSRKNVSHGVVALEDGAVVDMFTPKRADFLK